ncbi:glycosyltransferase [Sphingomonas sanguinis]|uniref:Glycosyltransferase n=2 Tax=Sphingomonas sanguinis TaxID=33051 RepID=A0ABU5LSV0_9SPHN|nr:glycosyltransferase [Sphingomonas sanguinis]
MPQERVRNTASNRRLWFLGALPPPLNGQSNANAAMLDNLSDRSIINVLPLGVTLTSKIWRGLANAAILACRVRAGDRAYLSVPGQAGSWLLLPAVLTLRLRGAAMWFHHHSYRSINRWPLRGIKALVAAAGRAQHHLLLSPGMRNRFAALYLSGDRGRALSLSNAFLFGTTTAAPPKIRADRPPTLGHASVLTRAKGVFYLLDLFERLLVSVPEACLVIAGPCADTDLLAAIEAAVRRHPTAIEYRGMVVGMAKQAFYGDIDLFVLPTTLVDEAEPLVMFEAYAAGVDVMAADTGCIADRIRARECLLTLDLTHDTELIKHRLERMTSDWEEARAANRAHLNAISVEAENEASSFLGLLFDDPKPKIAKE